VCKRCKQKWADAIKGLDNFVEYFGYKFDVQLLDDSPDLKAGIEEAKTEDEMKAAVEKWAAGKGLWVTFETWYDSNFKYIQLRIPG